MPLPETFQFKQLLHFVDSVEQVRVPLPPGSDVTASGDALGEI